jgi:ribonuclease BN (tRNA processing enzyme)
MKNSGIKFIGTGSGKTSLKRFHSSFLIYNKGYNLLVDAGDGISRAILYHKIPFSSINGILITHLHPDHFSGLVSLIIQIKMTGRKNNLQIFVHKNIKRFLLDFLFHSYLFKEKFEFDIFIESFDHNKIFKLHESFSFLTKQNSHLNKYKKYSSAKKLNFSCSSILFEINKKNIFYTGDIGKKEDLYLFKNYTLDLMISEISHVSIDDLIEVSKHLNPGKLFITHISDDTEESLKRKKSFLTQNNIVPVVDGFTIKI